MLLYFLISVVAASEKKERKKSVKLSTSFKKLIGLKTDSVKKEKNSKEEGQTNRPNSDSNAIINDRKDYVKSTLDLSTIPNRLSDTEIQPNKHRTLKPNEGLPNLSSFSVDKHKPSSAPVIRKTQYTPILKDKKLPDIPIGTDNNSVIKNASIKKVSFSRGISVEGSPDSSSSIHDKLHPVISPSGTGLPSARSLADSKANSTPTIQHKKFNTLPFNNNNRPIYTNLSTGPKSPSILKPQKIAASKSFSSLPRITESSVNPIRTNNDKKPVVRSPTGNLPYDVPRNLAKPLHSADSFNVNKKPVIVGFTNKPLPDLPKEVSSGLRPVAPLPVMNKPALPYLLNDAYDIPRSNAPLPVMNKPVLSSLLNDAYDIPRSNAPLPVMNKPVLSPLLNDAYDIPKRSISTTRIDLQPSISMNVSRRNSSINPQTKSCSNAQSSIQNSHNKFAHRRLPDIPKEESIEDSSDNTQTSDYLSTEEINTWKQSYNNTNKSTGKLNSPVKQNDNKAVYKCVTVSDTCHCFVHKHRRNSYVLTTVYSNDSQTPDSEYCVMSGDKKLFEKLYDEITSILSSFEDLIISLQSQDSEVLYRYEHYNNDFFVSYINNIKTKISIYKLEYIINPDIKLIDLLFGKIKEQLKDATIWLRSEMLSTTVSIR